MTSIRVRRWDPDSEEPRDMWARLNEGWREIVLALTPQLPSQQTLREVDFTGPAVSLAFDTPGIVTRPRAVLLGSLYRLDTGATSAISLSWTFDQGMITTTSFSGLAATQWRATFLVIGA